MVSSLWLSNPNFVFCEAVSRRSSLLTLTFLNQKNMWPKFKRESQSRKQGHNANHIRTIKILHRSTIGTAMMRKRLVSSSSENVDNRRSQEVDTTMACITRRTQMPLASMFFSLTLSTRQVWRILPMNTASSTIPFEITLRYSKRNWASNTSTSHLAITIQLCCSLHKMKSPSKCRNRPMVDKLLQNTSSSTCRKIFLTSTKTAKKYFI